jgi:hypothetical protein
LDLEIGLSARQCGLATAGSLWLEKALDSIGKQNNEQNIKGYDKKMCVCVSMSKTWIAPRFKKTEGNVRRQSGQD